MIRGTVILLFVWMTSVSSADAEIPGRRIDLGDATLFSPDGYRPRAGRADLLFHMHGAVPVVEKALAESGAPAPCSSLTARGFPRSIPRRSPIPNYFRAC